VSVQLRPDDVRPAAVAAPARPRTSSAVRLPLRLTRRGILLLALTAAAYAVVEVVSYRGQYPDDASRERLAAIADTGAVRMLQGVPRAVDTVGGFVVWDAGWFLSLIVAIWAMLATTRLLRAEEDKGHADVVLAAPVTATRVLLSSVAVVTAGALAFGLTAGLTLTLLGVPAGGSFLFGLGLAGVGVTTVAVAALASQLFEVRRRAVAATSTMLGLAFVLRMVGNSEDGREGLLVATPFGWVDRLQPFAGDRWAGLLLFLVVPVLLVALAVRERSVRDTGASRFAGSDTRSPRSALLSGPVAFGWRLTSGLLLAWAAGLALFGAVMGSLVGSVVDFFEDDSFRETLEQFGYDVSDPVGAFLALMAVFFALIFAMYIAWRIGALRQEEGSERLEHLLVRGVVRSRWLAASAALSLLAAALVVLATGAGIWIGGALTDADVGLHQAFVPLLATLPLVTLFGGIAVLAFGTVPRLTVAVPVTAAVLAYLLDLIGPLLDLPQWALDLSPFAWLPRPPAEPFELAPAVVMTLLGLAAAVVGVLAFRRRDVVGD
jgi:ABC-2 type transport system permease protein